MTIQSNHAPDCKPGVYGEPTADAPPAPAFDVNAGLRAVLEATRDKVRAARVIDLWRDKLDREARRRYAAEQSAPAWNTPKLGKVRLDPKPATAHVTDPGELATYVLSIAPGEVTATIELAGADLEEALTALDFAGIKVQRSSAEVRPAYLKPFLDGLTVVEAAPERIEEETGEVVPAVDAGAYRDLGVDDGLDRVPGLGVTPAGAQLNITLDAALKRETLARVDHELAEPAPADPTCSDATHVAAGLHNESRCAADEAHASDVGAALIAQAQGAGLPVTTAAELGKVKVPGKRMDEDTRASLVADAQRKAADERAAAIRARHQADTDRLAVPIQAGDLNTSRTVRLSDAESRDAPRQAVEPTDPAAHNAAIQAGRDAAFALSIEALLDYSGDELRRACRRATLSATGRKADLAERLHQYGVNFWRMKELTAP